MPPSGGLAVGDLLAGRFRLLEAVSGSGATVLWRARDEALARPVAVKVAAASGAGEAASTQRFLAAAIRSGAAVHPGLVRVYDAAVEDWPGGAVGYVISEWVEGERVDVLLKQGPLAAPEAAGLLRQAADALEAAHARGLVHGRLHPGNVLVTATGRVRITDTGVAAVLHADRAGVGAGAGAAVGVGDRDRDPADEPTTRDDTRDLAAVAFALLTGRWPEASPQPAGALRPSAFLCPRQVRAGVPRDLDAAVARGLDPTRPSSALPLTTPARLAAAVDAAAVEIREARAAAALPTVPSRARRALPWVAAAAVVSTVGTTGWLFGLAVGDLPRRDNAVEAIVSTTTRATPTPAPGAARPAAPIDLTNVPIHDFDPPPGDGSESSDQVQNAVDLDATTAWNTTRYKSAALGSLKPGVGLLLDLGRSTTLQSVQVGLTAPGTTLELRTADAVGSSAEDFRLVGTSKDSARLATVTLSPGARGRYWLVWLTELPKDDRGYRVGVSELRFLGANTL